MLPKPFITALLAVVSLSSSASAWAHGNFGSDTSIWTASAHLFTSPLSLAALIGLALVLFGIREPLSVFAAGLAAAAAVLATFFSGQIPALAAPAAVVVMGLAAVAGWRPPVAVSLLLAVLAGGAAGSAADLEQPRWQEMTGMGVTVMVCTFWLLASSENLSRNPGVRLQALLPIARRIGGSWITAMALLLGALVVFGRHA